MFCFSKQVETTSALRLLNILSERFDVDIGEVILKIGDFIFSNIKGPVKVLTVPKIPTHENMVEAEFTLIDDKKLLLSIADNPMEGTRWPQVMYTHFCKN